MTNNWIWAGGFLALAVGGIGFGAKAGVESGRAALRLEATVMKTQKAEAQDLATAAALDNRATPPTPEHEAEATKMADATVKPKPAPDPEAMVAPAAETVASEPEAEPVAEAAPAPAPAETAPAPKTAAASDGAFESWPDETEGDAYPYAARIDVDALGLSPARI